MSCFNAGVSILVESIPIEQLPFGSNQSIDPDPFTITVSDKVGTEVVSGASMLLSSAGKYYFIIESQITWLKGFYNISISGTFAGITHTETQRRGFELI